jgi:hypothetical protein
LCHTSSWNECQIRLTDARVQCKVIPVQDGLLTLGRIEALQVAIKLFDELALWWESIAAITSVHGVCALVHIRVVRGLVEIGQVTRTGWLDGNWSQWVRLERHKGDGSRCCMGLGLGPRLSAMIWPHRPTISAHLDFRRKFWREFRTPETPESRSIAFLGMIWRFGHSGAHICAGLTPID